MEKNARIVTVATKKGGVGKTSFACNVSAGLSSKGFKVAAVDMDSQGHLARSFGINKLLLKETIYDVLLGDAQMDDIKTNAHGVDLYLSNEDLGEFESTVINPRNADFFPDPYVLLKLAIDQIRNKYDYIIIDTAPSARLDTLNALIGSTDVVIPMLPEGLAFDGVLDMLQYIRKVQKKFHPALNIMGVLPTMVQTTTLHGDILRELKIICMDMKVNVFDSVIRRTVMHGVSQTNGLPSVLDPAMKNSAAKDYIEFIEEAF